MEAAAEAARRQLHRHVYVGNLHTMVDQVGTGDSGRGLGEVGLAISSFWCFSPIAPSVPQRAPYQEMQLACFHMCFQRWFRHTLLPVASCVLCPPPPRTCASSPQSQRRSGGASNVHDWTFFVRMDSPEDEQRFIERVVVHLHPTFRCVRRRRGMRRSGGLPGAAGVLGHLQIAVQLAPQCLWSLF